MANISNNYEREHNTRAFTSKRIYKNIIITVHNFHQFEKVEWKKLVRAEIEATKYVLGQQRKSTSNERQTEFASPKLNS